MPVEFLTEDQRRRYRRFPGEPSPDQLTKYFHLDLIDRQHVRRRRSDPTRLGFALQLGTVRFLGAFLTIPTDVPVTVVKYVAGQLEVEPRCIDQYRVAETQQDHAAEIREHYGYSDFSDPSESFRLVRWMYGRAWLSEERPSVLFDLATARLVERKVLLPGVTVLARLVARVRERVATRLWRSLSQGVSDEQRTHLEALLVVPEDARLSGLERLRRSPTSFSADRLKEALLRLREIRDLGADTLDLAGVPPGRVDALARYGMKAWAPKIARMTDHRRIATLLAVARKLEVTAQDDVFDIFNQLLGKWLRKVDREGRNERLRSLSKYDAAALLCREVTLLVLASDRGRSIHSLRQALYHLVSRTELEEAADTIEELARPNDDPYFEHLLGTYGHARRFLPTFLDTIRLDCRKSGQPALEAFEALKRIESMKTITEDDLPLEVVSETWRALIVSEDGGVDRRAFTFCALEKIRDALRRRDVFVAKSERWGDPTARLLQGPTWETARPQICRILALKPKAGGQIEALAKELDEAYRSTLDHAPSNTALQIGNGELAMSSLEAIEEPASLVALRACVHALMPRVDLPALLLEVARWTGFVDDFTHVSEGRSRVDDLTTSVCGALVAEACNIGIEPVARPDVPALTRGRLGWVTQNFLRAETIHPANGKLVEAQTRITLAQKWGGGDVASADGIRFVVPVRSLHAGPNQKYFGGRRISRGVTYYNFDSDQFAGFKGIVIPGTIRDSVYILEGLLEHEHKQETILRPHQIMTDNAAYSDVVFGLFHLLGYQFSPRLAGIGKTRFWRIDPNADYGVLNSIARHRVNVDLIEKNWDDLLRVAGSLKLGKVSAAHLMQSLQRGGRPTTLARALGEYGRISKTLHLLAFVDDETYRRRIHVQLNRQEGRHALMRSVFHGRRGELRQSYREGQEDQLDALNFVVNAIVLWNTRYAERVLDHLRESGIEVRDEDVARLSPLGHEHINLLGRYHFGLPEEVLGGALRPLRVLDDLGLAP